jgi:hypothetical protein
MDSGFALEFGSEETLLRALKKKTHHLLRLYQRKKYYIVKWEDLIRQ